MLNNYPKYLLSLSELADILNEKESIVRKGIDKNALVDLLGNRKALLPHAVKECLSEMGVDYSFKVIAHINLRGGIGKTTTTITSATRAVQYGFKTAVLDMDPQGSSSLAFNKAPEDDDPIFFDVWQNPSEMVMPSLSEIEENLHILPSSLENALLDSILVNPSSQKKAVKNVCLDLKENGFDLVFIDSPPSLGAAVISTICAAHIVVIPVCSDAFSLKGLQLTLNEISSICETFNIDIPKVMILYTKYDKRISISKQALDELNTKYGDMMAPNVIRTSTEFSKALEKRETIFASSKKSTAKDDYDGYVRYILDITNKKG